MRDFIDQIQKSLEANLYYLALFATLSLPEICGTMDTKEGKASPEAYKKWYNENVGAQYTGTLTGEECYKLFSTSEQPNPPNADSTYTRILFVEPTAITQTFHNNIYNDALNIDISIFCNDVLTAVQLWLEKVENTDLYKSHEAKFMKRYPDGIKPYITGFSVIA